MLVGLRGSKVQQIQTVWIFDEKICPTHIPEIWCIFTKGVHHRCPSTGDMIFNTMGECSSTRLHLVLASLHNMFTAQPERALPLRQVQHTGCCKCMHEIGVHGVSTPRCTTLFGSLQPEVHIPRITSHPERLMASTRNNVVYCACADLSSSSMSQSSRLNSHLVVQASHLTSATLRVS